MTEKQEAYIEYLIEEFSDYLERTARSKPLGDI